jgi:hypothetical protein
MATNLATTTHLPTAPVPGAATAMLNYYRGFLRTISLGNQQGDDDVWR